jgi:argininosuccinate lyase
MEKNKNNKETVGIWGARFKGQLETIANHFNSSISFDSKMYKEDIEGSKKHAMMLEIQGIISKEDLDSILNGLEEIEKDLNDGNLQVNPNSEDIHMFVEEILTKRIGKPAKKLHTARSRNDQVALDIKLYLRNQIQILVKKLKHLIETLSNLAKNNLDTIMPGYTHMQIAQPITFAHHLMAYAQMFIRDIYRLKNAEKIMDKSPIGAGALATTTYDIDRFLEASLLGYDMPTRNSLDSVSDRDHVIEIANNIAIISMHMSRISEEMIIWQSNEFKFIEISDKYSTGSSIMPQKKNPDMCELIRGKTGRIYGNLIALLTMMKGLPLAYNKDMQEDKEPIFDSIENIIPCIDILDKMLETLTVNKKIMAKKAEEGYINATDVADYLTKKGLPFREAYKITGSIVKYAIDNKKTLNELSLDEYITFSDIFTNDIYNAINIHNCVESRNIYGGPSKEAVSLQIKETLEEISKY